MESRLKVVKYPNDVLTTKCQSYDFAVDLNFQASGMKLHETLDAMVNIMDSENGMGLAANQVGIPYRFFIMRDLKGKIWEFINPVITESEEECIMLNEGCLSAPGAFVQIPRRKSVTVKAQDRNGEEFTVIALDLEAVCVQHEIDHLDGIFYLDKVNRQQRRNAYRILGIKK